MEIRIDRGYKSYDVTDADGTVLGTVRLNLADAGLMGRFEEARRKIEAMVQDAGADANPDTMIAVDKAVKEQFYICCIKRGLITLDKVPEKWREAVRAEMEGA